MFMFNVESEIAQKNLQSSSLDDVRHVSRKITYRTKLIELENRLITCK
jgi:hypothetical protein